MSNDTKKKRHDYREQYGQELTAGYITDEVDTQEELDVGTCISMTPAGEMAFEVSREKAIARKESLEHDLCTQDNIWGYSELGKAAKNAAATLASTKNGLYSRVPLICKADGCPYRDSCKLIDYELAPKGEYCPIETTQIENAVTRYAAEFDIRDEDYTDQNILKEIVNLEIMMERCKALMANEQNPVIDVITAVTESGDSWTHPEVSKAFEIYDRCQRQHTSLLSLMNATRKDKRGTVNTSGSSISDILNKIHEIEQNGGFVDPTEPISVPYEDKT